jgi:hypothetical protein
LPPNTKVFDPTSPSVLKRTTCVIKRGCVTQQINCWLDQKEKDNCHRSMAMRNIPNSAFSKSSSNLQTLGVRFESANKTLH